MVTHPSHWQIREHIVGCDQFIELYAALRCRDKRLMALAHALGLARGTRRVEHHRHIGCFAERDFLIVALRICFMKAGTCTAQSLKAHQPRRVVAAQAARVFEDDVFDLGACFARLQQLVDLLLIFHNRKANVGIVKDVHHFGRNRVLIHRHRHTTQRLRSGESHVQTGSVVANDRQMIAALEAKRSKPQGHRAHFGGGFGP